MIGASCLFSLFDAYFPNAKLSTACFICKPIDEYKYWNEVFQMTWDWVIWSKIHKCS